jgi:malonyl-CoA O-methyltransferase
MLRHSRKSGRRFFSKQSYLCADAEHLPLAPQSLDMVFSNLMLQWCQDPRRLFSGLARALKPGGLFIFSSLGPDTLHELRACWEAADDLPHVNSFVDMHDLGDSLIRAGFTDPVMETDRLILTYDDVDTLMQDLKRLGAHNVHAGRRKALTGKGRFDRVRELYERSRRQGKLPATYEVVYGHAWLTMHAGGGQAGPREAVISVESVRQALKKQSTSG